ncbi:UNVERIFIED_CONTAM: hypothetical protein PYX00_000133 [Menopon gallinae]|uniref:Regulation of nuclear pre-mRNA domain-containing protein 2 n=1 Tax=Menopon gallinae TaxID=328185 RepID=A0AAW2I917_9NEOP
MTATSVFNEQQFESKLVSLKDSQDAINSLSSWCLQNREHHKKIVNCWLHCLKRVKIEQRLSLFYLANDVIQYSKRKHYQFVESWGTALQKATTLVRDDKVKSRIMRIFKIWDERGVYDEAFIADLCGLLSTNIKKKTETSTDSSEFQPSVLIGKIRECKVLEDDTDLRFRKVKENPLELTDADNMRTCLKDRKHGSDIAAEVDHGVKRMEAYVKALEVEIAEREKLIDILYQATLFYESQRGEAKLVCNAYRNFGNKVKILKRKLDELIPTLSDSPIPSPDANAPSPSPDSDLDFSSQQKSKRECTKEQSVDNNSLDFSFVNSTFMGNSQFLDINFQRDMFNNTPLGGLGNSQNPNSNEINVRPIEVINTREQKENVGFNISDFLKSLLPSGASKTEDTTDSIPASQPPALQPLQPPPMPPLFTTGDAFGSIWKSGWEQSESAQTGNAWNHEGGSQDWSVPQPVPDPWQGSSGPINSDTPESPPLYEKEPVREPVEYDDSISARSLLPMGQLQDIDHRIGQDMDHRLGLHRRVDLDHRKLQKLGPKDVDHRNLISLTGSPRKETKPLQPPPAFVWPGDQDYRTKPADVDFRISQRPSDLVLSTNFNPCQPPPKAPSSEAGERKDVNVESIDMDVSEEDEEDLGNIIQEEEVEDKKMNSADLSFLNRSNLTNFSMASSFMENSTSAVQMNQDVDERLKTIFGTRICGPGKLPSEYDDESSRSNEVPLSMGDIRHDQDRDNREMELDKSKSNGFLEDSQEGNDYYRREQSWHADGMSEVPPPCHMGPVGPVSRGDFPVRIPWNSPRPRGRGQNHRFPFRPHHPRQESLRPRLPFRPRVHMRGGRW